MIRLGGVVSLSVPGRPDVVVTYFLPGEFLGRVEERWSYLHKSAGNASKSGRTDKFGNGSPPVRMAS